MAFSLCMSLFVHISPIFFPFYKDTGYGTQFVVIQYDLIFIWLQDPIFKQSHCILGNGKNFRDTSSTQYSTVCIEKL